MLLHRPIVPPIGVLSILPFPSDLHLLLLKDICAERNGNEPPARNIHIVANGKAKPDLTQIG